MKTLKKCVNNNYQISRLTIQVIRVLIDKQESYLKLSQLKILLIIIKKGCFIIYCELTIILEPIY